MRRRTAQKSRIWGFVAWTSLCVSACGNAPLREPSTATGIAAVEAARALQASTFALNDTELLHLRRDGFVISDRHSFSTIADGWLAIYKADLPLYVTADALLFAIHRSLDAILRDIEQWELVPTLEKLVVAMRARLNTTPSLSARMRDDADLFTAVALALLEDKMANSAKDAAPAISDVVEQANAAAGPMSEFVRRAAKDRLLAVQAARTL